MLLILKLNYYYRWVTFCAIACTKYKPCTGFKFDDGECLVGTLEAVPGSNFTGYGQVEQIDSLCEEEEEQEGNKILQCF